MDMKFSQQSLTRILDQSVLYQCACPAQVCRHISQQRALFAYQSECLNLTDVDYAVHRRIADAVRRNHAEMENCLEDILRMEGWDMATLELPEALKARMLQP